MAKVVVDRETDDVYGPFASEEEAAAYMKKLGAEQGWGPTEEELKAEPDYPVFDFGLVCVDLIEPNGKANLDD